MRFSTVLIVYDYLYHWDIIVYMFHYILLGCFTNSPGCGWLDTYSYLDVDPPETLKFNVLSGSDRGTWLMDYLFLLIFY